jgi:hypothetical protein
MGAAGGDIHSTQVKAEFEKTALVTSPIHFAKTVRANGKCLWVFTIPFHKSLKKAYGHWFDDLVTRPVPEEDPPLSVDLERSDHFLVSTTKSVVADELLMLTLAATDFDPRLLDTGTPKVLM